MGCRTAQQGLAQATINRRVRGIKAWSRWLVEEDWLKRDRLAKLKPPKVDDRAPKTFDPTEVDRLLAACKAGRGNNPQRDSAIILLLYSTGLRASELIGLLIEDIDWSQGLIIVRRGKGGKFRVVPLTGKAEKAVDRYLRNRVKDTKPLVAAAALNTITATLTHQRAVEGLAQPKEARIEQSGEVRIVWDDGTTPTDPGYGEVSLVPVKRD